MASVKEIENILAERFNRKHCILTGSGTTSIFLILKTLRLKKGDAVLMPGSCCFAPAYAVKYAGAMPVFCDISLRDGCVIPESVESALDKNPRIKVFIGVHLYGNVLEIDDISAICRKRRVVFIEDACQSYGSGYKGRPCGSFGDFSVLSFGHTKILDAGGTGAVLSDNSEVMAIVKQESGKLKTINDGVFHALSVKHRRKYYELKKISSLDKRKKKIFGNLWKEYKDLFIHAIDINVLSKLSDLLGCENVILARRLKMAKRFRTALKGCRKITFFKPKYGSIPWRFCFMVNGINNEALCRCVRKEGLDISSWYPNLAPMFEPEIKMLLKNCDALENRVINLWLDETKNDSYVLRICKSIKKCLSKHV